MILDVFLYIQFCRPLPLPIFGLKLENQGQVFPEFWGSSLH